MSSSKPSATPGAADAVAGRRDGATRRRLCHVMVAAFCLAVGCAPVVAARPELMVDPWAAPLVLDRTAREPEALRCFGRVHIVLFANGQICFPADVPPFRVSPAYRGEDPIGPLVASCTAARVPWSATLDLLRWHFVSQDDAGLFRLYPTWQALRHPDACQTCGDPEEYASPFHPAVASALAGVLEQACRLQPSGLTLSFQWSNRDVLGYELAAREAYVRENGTDPVDLDQRGSGALDEWFAWRSAKFTEFLHTLLASVGEDGKTLPVTIWWQLGGSAAAEDPRRPSAAPVLDWLQTGLVARAAVDAQWAAQPEVWSSLSGAVARPDSLLPLIRSRDLRRQSCLSEQIRAVTQGSNPPSQPVFYPTASEDWPAAVEAAETWAHGDAAQDR